MVTNAEYKSMDAIMGQRRKQAEDRDIYHKAIEIVKRRGTSASKGHGANHNYSDDHLSIWWDDYGSNMEIGLATMNDQASSAPVFKVHLSSITCYRPDVPDWEARLDKLYENLEPRMKAEEAVARTEKKSEFFNAWGVWPNP